jgi:hypothetical protein
MACHSLRERSFRSVPANASKSPRSTSSRFPLFRARSLPAQTQRRTVSADRPVSRAASLISNSSCAIPATKTFYYIRRGVVEVANPGPQIGRAPDLRGYPRLRRHGSANLRRESPRTGGSPWRTLIEQSNLARHGGGNGGTGRLPRQSLSAKRGPSLSGMPIAASDISRRRCVTAPRRG